ncbi:MAG: Holliday junction resolvase RuvX, partial [Pseudomonadota bacterium]
MITTDISEWAQALPRAQAVLGLDLGTKTIGLAISDLRHSIATPFETIKRRKFSIDAAALQSVIAQRQIGGLVLGLPLNMDGSEGPRAQSTRAFARNFTNLHPIPIL